MYFETSNQRINGESQVVQSCYYVSCVICCSICVKHLDDLFLGKEITYYSRIERRTMVSLDWRRLCGREMYPMAIVFRICVATRAVGHTASLKLVHAVLHEVHYQKKQIYLI